MSDLSLLIHDLTKITILIGVAVLVVTAPARAAAAGSGFQSPMCAGLVGTSAIWHTDNQTMSSWIESDDDYFVGQSALDQTDFLEVAAASHELDDWQYESMSQALPDLFEPIANIDGTSMCGIVDTNGNPFGVTESHFDCWDGGGMCSGSMHD